jgi:hypothetical protein
LVLSPDIKREERKADDSLLFNAELTHRANLQTCPRRFDGLRFNTRRALVTKMLLHYFGYFVSLRTEIISEAHALSYTEERRLEVQEVFTPAVAGCV